jgi:predicted RNase H-like HicB family nuclease
MTTVREPADLTAFDVPSQRVGLQVRNGQHLAGGDWTTTLRAGKIEYSPPKVQEFDYTLVARPLRWKLERTETGFAASNTVTGIFGFGATVVDATRDLLSALQEHRETLEQQDSLSPELQHQLTYLQQFDQ